MKFTILKKVYGRDMIKFKQYRPIVENIPMLIFRLDDLKIKLKNNEMNQRYFNTFIHLINTGFPLKNININRSNHSIQDYDSAQLIIFLQMLTTRDSGLYFDLESGELDYSLNNLTNENYIASWLFFDALSLIRFTRTKSDEFNDRYSKVINDIWAKITRYPIVVNELYEYQNKKAH